MIVTSGLSWRAVSVISTAVSSRPTATTTLAAWLISALASMSRLVASPVTPTRPALFASRMASGEWSTTTIEPGGVPVSRKVASAARPFVPYPMTTVCPDTRDLHREMRQPRLVRSASTSSVVPIRTIRKTTRIGVMTSVFTSRAAGVTGTMSP